MIDYPHGPKQIKLSPLAQELIRILSCYAEFIAEQQFVFTSNPYVDVFVKQANKASLINAIANHQALAIQDGIYHQLADYQCFLRMLGELIKFLSDIRMDMQSHWFKSTLYNAQRVADKNRKGLFSYINSLFDCYARLLVIRIDFSYQIGNTIKTEEDRYLKYLEAKTDREHLFNNMANNSLFEQLVGFVWKLEYGLDKGFHYHMLFFFDGSRVREDQTIATLIGEYWANNITQGRGLYYNCNANKHLYHNLGIGMINYYDSALRAGLNQAAAYLIKTDHYAKTLIPNNARAFGRGEMLKPRALSLGRRRSM